MKKQKKIFITGTDTDVGKTLITTTLIHQLQSKNQTVTAIKPVAAGCDVIDGKLVNSDALILQKAMNQKLSYAQVNPIALKSAIAPHIAATEEGIQLSVENLQKECNLQQYQSDFILVEGAGGWLVPLNKQETFADFVQAESFEVILVVAMKLGCINHALLTIQNIKMRGLKLVGWIANSTSSAMPYLKENIQTINSVIHSPLLAEIPFIDSDSPDSDNFIKKASSYVNIASLL